MKRYLFALILVAAVFFHFSARSWIGPFKSSDDLLVYTSRQDHLVKPIFDKYKAETGESVRFVSGEAPVLIERMKQEGPNSEVDVLLTVDAGNLWQAASLGLLEPVTSKVLLEKVPEHLRDQENQWFGLSVRARTVFYNSDRVDPANLSTYEDLADPKWRGKLCLRTSKKVYNQSLVAMLIEHHGEKKAESIVKGWVENLAEPVYSNDTQLLAAIDEGKCAVGIANTYYFGRYQIENPKTDVKLFWPNQTTSGVHVNISGAGVIRSSDKKEKAIRFVEWLTTPEVQKLLAESNLEYPVVSGVPWDDVVQKWGAFKQDQLPVGAAGTQQAAAIRLMDRVGYR